MLTTTVQKDIGEYEEKVILGLTTKRLVSISVCVALAIAEAVFGIFVLGVDISNMAIPIFATAAVGFVIGYLEPMGLPFTEALPYLVRQNFGTTQLSYVSAGELVADAATKGKTGKKDRKASHVRKEQVKEYRRIRDYRGERSAEYLLPKYAEARREVEREWRIDLSEGDET